MKASARSPDGLFPWNFIVYPLGGWPYPLPALSSGFPSEFTHDLNPIRSKEYIS